MSAFHPRLTPLVCLLRPKVSVLLKLRHRPSSSQSQRIGALEGQRLFSLPLQGAAIAVLIAVAVVVSASVSVKQTGPNHPSLLPCVSLSGQKCAGLLDFT